MRYFTALLFALPATALAQPATPAPGDAIISEFMSRPGSGKPEWVEVLNVADAAIELQGCVFADSGASSHTISDSVVVQPGERVLLSKGAMPDDCPQADYEYTAVSLNDGGDSLVLSCPPDLEGEPIDELVYGDGEGAFPPAGEGHSFFVCEESLAGDEREYREAFEVGCGGWAATPGEANEACPVPPPYPIAGEVVIAEVAVRASTGTAESPEWIELLGKSADVRNLDGCALLRATASGTEDQRMPIGERLTLQAGQRVVFSTKAFPETCVVDGVHDLKTVNPPTTSTFKLILECPGAAEEAVEIDSTVVDWKGSEPAEVDTLQLDPDDAGYFCTASTATSATVEGCETVGGTPGRANGQCPTPPPPPAPYPAAGGLVITEVLTRPEAGPEWFELYNPFNAPGPVNVAGCTVAETGPVKDLVKGCPENTSCTEHVHTLEGRSVNVEAGAYLLLAKSDCAPFPDAHCVTYGKLSFNGDQAEDLWLTCPTAPGEEPSVEIDRITYDEPGDLTGMPLAKGRSAALKPECVKADGATTNDGVDCWCVSTGTPGEPNACDAAPGPGDNGNTPGGGPSPKLGSNSGCSCRLGSSSPSGAAALVLLLGLLLRRRRR